MIYHLMMIMIMAEIWQLEELLRANIEELRRIGKIFEREKESENEFKSRGEITNF